jgi:hypothetical protein
MIYTTNKLFIAIFRFVFHSRAMTYIEINVLKVGNMYFFSIQELRRYIFFHPKGKNSPKTENHATIWKKNVEGFFLFHSTIYFVHDAVNPPIGTVNQTMGAVNQPLNPVNPIMGPTNPTMSSVNQTMGPVSDL